MARRTVAYLPGYSSDKARGLDISSLPGNRFSDLVYCFAGFQQQQDSWIPTFPEPHDTTPGSTHNVARLIALKTQWPALNVVMSIGGWAHSHEGDPTFKTTPAFSAVAATPAARQAFVAACMNMFIAPTHPVIGPLFGGIDIDWEFPGVGDVSNLTALFQEFRTQLDMIGQQQGRPLTLSCTFAGGNVYLDVRALNGLLDWFGLMTYLAHRANHNAQNQTTDFGAPVFGSSAEPRANATWTIDSTVKGYLAEGVQAEKLLVGVSAYAHSYAGVANVNNGLYQPYTGPGPGSLGKTEILEYKDLMVNYFQHYDYVFDATTRSAYLYSPADQIWISFENPESVAAKAAYVSDMGLGGLLLWELSADAPSAETQTPLPGITALIDAIPFGLRSLAPKAVLEQTSGTAPALAFLKHTPFLACRHAATDTLELSLSTDNSAKYGGTFKTAETSDAAPALALSAGGDQVIMAWKGSTNDNLNVAALDLATPAAGKFSITGLKPTATLGETSHKGPCLAAAQGHLFLAWTGRGDAHLNVTLSADNGATFTGKFVSPETSDDAPSLASHKGRLFIAWKGSGNDTLNVAEVGFFADTQGGFGIQGLTNKVVIAQTSDAAPALCSDGRRLFLAWKGSGNPQLNVMFSSDDGASFVDAYTSPESTDIGPALASDGSQVIIGWRGSGNLQLNVAQVASY